MDELTPGVAPHQEAPPAPGAPETEQRWASAPVPPAPPAGPVGGSAPPAPPGGIPTVAAGVAPPGASPTMTFAEAMSRAEAPPAAPAPGPAPPQHRRPCPHRAASTGYAAPTGSPPPPMPPAPTHQPVPGLAPDVRGADVGLAPEAPGMAPIPEVRIAESEATAYARISTEDEVQQDDFSLAEALLTMMEMRGSDLHLTAGAPPTVRVDGSLRPIPGRCRADSGDDPARHVLDRDPAAAGALRGDPRAGLLLRPARSCPLPCEPLPPARFAGRRVPGDPVRDQEPRVARDAGCDGELRGPAARVRPGHGSHRLGEVHDAGSAGGPRQPDQARAHHDRRGPDRVPARAQELPGQPA